MIREYFGQAGHFVASKRCQFHIHTHVRGLCISTVGEYFPGGGDTQEALTSDPAHLYETMVFTLDGDEEPIVSDPLETKHWFTRGEANTGHENITRHFEGCVEHEECREHHAMALACIGMRAVESKSNAE